MEQKKKQLTKQIAETSQLLDEVRSSKKESLGELNVLSEQVKNRQKLINNLSSQVGFIEENMSVLKEDVGQIEEELVLLKDEYSKMVQYAYKTRNSYNATAFIFASKSFNDAFKRIKYIKYYNDYRAQKVQLITGKKDTLEHRLVELEVTKEEKKTVLASKENERDKIEKEKKKTQQIVSNLKKKESELNNDIDNKRVMIDQLDREIADIIGSKIDRVDYKLTPEAKELSGKFQLNKGKLPWPVEKGIITERFGKNKHKVVRNVSITNNGVNIATTKNSDARSIYSGKVERIIFSPSFKHAVIINHGEYFSVYSQIEEVYVSKGESIGAKQKIGKVFTDEENAATEIHLELWKGTQKLNPEKWILKR